MFDLENNFLQFFAIVLSDRWLRCDRRIL